MSGGGGGEQRGTAPSPAALCALRGGAPLSDRPSRAVTQTGPAPYSQSAGAGLTAFLLAGGGGGVTREPERGIWGCRARGRERRGRWAPPGACLRCNGGSGVGAP